MKTIGIAAGALALAGFAAPAIAQTIEREMVPAPLRAPRRTFEVSAELGYTQGFGALYGGRQVRDVAQAGIALGVGVGVRATPLLSVAATGQFQGFNASDNLPNGTQARGASAGIEATIHLAPYERADPWLSLGTGYRMLWEVPQGDSPSTLTHGFELGALAIGIDLRPSEDVAISPMIGADLDMFAWRSPAGAGMSALSDRTVSAFVFAGLRGRFDVGGTRVSKLEQKTVTTITNTTTTTTTTTPAPPP
jgi:hypothetical protein